MYEKVLDSEKEEKVVSMLLTSTFINLEILNMKSGHNKL
jgi:hypothetical protein